MLYYNLIQRFLRFLHNSEMLNTKSILFNAVLQFDTQVSEISTQF